MDHIKPATYISILNLPYQNHVAAKDLLIKLHAMSKERANALVKLRVPKKTFSKMKKRTLRGLFNFCFVQQKFYCPVDIVKVRVMEHNILLTYHIKQTAYKGMEEL